MINIKRYGTLCLSAILAAAFVLTPAVKIFAEEGDTAADRETQRQTCRADGFKWTDELAAGTGSLC